MSRTYVKWAIILAIIVVLAFAVPALGKGKPDNPGGGGNRPPTESTNNLSFPVIAVDAFSITALTAPSFTVPYAGTYSGLTADEIAALTATGPWYPQKTTGNVWQADFLSETHANVTCVDWSDSMEVVYPKPGTPFRLEVVLYKDLTALDVDTGLAMEPMTGYTMAVLENPSSKDELQGTNTTTYESNYATVVSSQPKLLVQYLGESVPALTWDAVASRWTLADTTVPRVDPVSFAVELNVGGKYIFGASKKGWVPASEGFYRVTFYAPTGSQVDLRNAITGDAAAGYLPGTGTAAVGQIDNINNLAYIDLEVGGEGDPGGDE